MALIAQSAGILLLTLQQYGTPMYTSRQLKRSLHPDLAAQKGALLEQQFLAAEVKDVYNDCYDAALCKEEMPTGKWHRFKQLLLKLGVKF